MPRAPDSAGSGLARSPLVLDRISPERWRRALAAAADRRWARGWVLLLGVTHAAWVGMCVSLWRLGYPRWRVVALIGILGVLLVRHARDLWVRRFTVLDPGERIPLYLVLACAAMTGGIHSPLIVGIPGIFSGMLLRRGWSRESKVGLAAFLMAAVTMAVVPDAWVGPRIPDPTFTITALAVLVFSVALNTDYMVTLMRTADHALHQMLRARDERAADAFARAAELERMSSHLSHELKNPLGAIKALVQLSVRSERDLDIRARLEVVESEAERMQSILQEYLSFSRPIDDLHPEAVALGALADEVLTILDGRADGARVALRRGGDASITGDPRRLKQALLNLVANAIEATPPGGEVEVQIEESAGTARIAVRDTGRGMSADVLERIGTPFFTTREAGTGLGVSLARGTFVQHGGTLAYVSAPGRGTVATATLPSACKETGTDGTRAAGR